MNVSLRVMRYFAAAAHRQSLSKAATELNISQSAVSTAIDSFEEEIGIKLFFRKRSQGISLTTSGRSILARVQTLLDDVDDFENGISDYKNGISGELHVGCFTPIAPIILAPILKKMTADHAKINVTISEGNVRHIFDCIHRGEIDVGISYDEADISGGLKTRTLAVVPAHIILPENHPLASHEKIYLKDLENDPLILLDMPSSRQYYTSIFEDAGISPNFKYRSSNFEMVRSLVGAGLGVALLQTRPPTEMTHGNHSIVYKPIADDHRKAPLLVAYTDYTIRRRAVEVFVRYAEEYFRSADAKQINVQIPN